MNNIVYLMRHGEASRDLSSLESTLTDRGVAQVSDMGEKLKKEGIEIEKIYHSGLLRARKPLPSSEKLPSPIFRNMT